MDNPQISDERIEAIEKDLKRKHGGKLPYLFIFVFAAACAWIDTYSPTRTYGGHFAGLAFFGWFSWLVCRELEVVAKRWKGDITNDTNKNT